MINENRLNNAENILNSMDDSRTIVKRVKKDRSLIERSESANRVILVEDNRQVILG